VKQESKALQEAAKLLSRQVDSMTFSRPPGAVIYNPLDYAWEPFAAYTDRYGGGKKKILFLGMNPGPWGMAQTGVPFGEVETVKNWLGIDGRIKKPREEHPKRPIEGFDCRRSEVSGLRLWVLMKERFNGPDDFFRDHLIVNYCPLIFLEPSGRNKTPDKLPKEERNRLQEACDIHLKRVIEITGAEYLIGIGKYAEKAFMRVAGAMGKTIASVLHPSPANPAANRGWGEQASKHLEALGVWVCE